MHPAQPRCSSEDLLLQPATPFTIIVKDRRSCGSVRIVYILFLFLVAFFFFSIGGEFLFSTDGSTQLLKLAAANRRRPLTKCTGMKLLCR